MKKINIQFFATLDENIAFITKVFNRNIKVILYAGENNFIKISSTNINKLKEILLRENDNFWQSTFFMSLSDFVNAPSYNEFCNINKNTLFLAVGEQNDKNLKESWLASSIFLNDLQTHKVFMEIAKKLKKETICGAFLRVEDENKEEFDKNVRYTEGAYSFNKVGGKVYQVNENIHFILRK